MSNQVPEWVHYGDGIGAVIVDYASYIWMVDEIKKDLDEMGYYELCVDIALIHLPITIEDVFGGTSLYDRAVKMFESQKDYFRDQLCGRI